MVYTIGIPGEDQQNYVKCYSSPIDEPDIEHMIMENVLRDAWIQRYYDRKLKPYMDTIEFEAVAKVMDIDVTTVEDFLKLRSESTDTK